MQRAFSVSRSLQTARHRQIRPLARCLTQRGGYGALFRRKRFVKTRLATIGGVAMNDPVLGRFVDRGNRRANLIGATLWGGADLFLQSAQMRLNAPITCGSSKGLSGTFSG